MKRTFPFHSNAVWPPLLLVVIFAVAYSMIEAGIWLIEILTPGEATADFANIRIVVLGCAAAAYAFFRVWRFHPACNPAYSAWLELSPWTAKKPLPLGPIQPVWQDAIVIGALAALARWHAHESPLVPVVAFGMTYLCGLNLLLAITRRWGSCLVLGFLWPTLMLPGFQGWPGFAVLAGIVIVLWHGIRASLRAFPRGFLQASAQPLGTRPRSLWQVQIELRIPGLSSSAMDTSSKAIGWPYLALSPKGEYPSVSTRTSFFLGLLFGWWTFCLSTAFEARFPLELILFLSVVLAGVRLLIYCVSVATPFNVWGRLASGRLVLPGFDRVFVTPLGVIVLGVFGGALIRGAGSQAVVAGAWVVGLLWFVALAGGPNLRNWLLTGQHRHRAPKLFSTKQPLRPL
jgi:hypothetical protein